MRLSTTRAANRPSELGSMFRFSWKRELQHDRKHPKITEVQQTELMTVQCLKFKYILSFLALGTQDAWKHFGFQNKNMATTHGWKFITGTLWARYYLLQECAMKIPRKKEAESFKERLFFMSTGQWTYEVSHQRMLYLQKLTWVRHWTRTWKRNAGRITYSINHVKLRKSPKNSWKLRECLWKYHLWFLFFCYSLGVPYSRVRDGMSVLMTLCTGAAAE